MTARVASTLICVFVALLPLGWPPLPWSMQPGDLLFPVVVLALLAARPAIPRHSLDAFVALYLIGSALSIPTSIAPRESALGLVKELYLGGVYLMLKAAVPALAGAERLCRWLCGATGVLAACSLAAAVVFYASGYVWYAVGNPMPLPYVGQIFRANGTLQAPEFFGNVLTFVIPLAAMLAAGAELNLPWLAVLAVLTVAEVLTFSKSLGGTAVALTVYFWPRWRSMPLLRATAAALAVALVIAFNAAAIVTIRRVDMQFGKDSRIPPPDSQYGRQDDAGADRLDLGVSYNPMSYYLVKKVAWQAFLDRPWTGIGLSTFVREAERAYQDGRLHQAYRRVQAHSLPFGRLAETGLVGAATLAALLVAVWRSMRQTARLPGVDGRVGWALAAGVAGLLVNSINVDAMHFRFLWFAIGLTAGISASNQGRVLR